MNGVRHYMETLTALARETVSESCVLIRNEGKTLPFQSGIRLAIFGVAQLHYYPSGLGSGGLVNTHGMTGLVQALEESGFCEPDGELIRIYGEWEKEHPFEAGDGWGHHPWSQEEMPVTEEMIASAAKRADAALVVIGRTAGEDNDSQNVPGSWKLSEQEEKMIERVSAGFKRTAVILNVGNVIDMTWVERTSPSAVMYVWQGGQEGARGTVDVLFGVKGPSGRLTDTVARSAEDYPSFQNFGDPQRNIYQEDVFVGYRYFETFAPEKVCYPFGYGLNYTDFRQELLGTEASPEGLTVRVRVTNTGSAAGKEVVQVYGEAPRSGLSKPARVLCGFAKTEELQPGESSVTEIRIPLDYLASFDDSGITGHPNCRILEKGIYRIYAGKNVRDAIPAGEWENEGDLVTEELEEACAPQMPFERLCMTTDGSMGTEPVPTATKSVNGSRAAMLPAEIPQTEDRGIRLEDVAEGRASMEAFVAQMTDEDLHTVVRGEGMSSPRVTPGTAGAIGGVSDSLTALGIPAVCCSDGPSGIRMDCGNIAFYLPSGTAMASTWNTDLITELYAMEGLDMRKNHIDMLLGPGMNIHRHPLNGRNFEYFSEDPLITGRMASAQLKGMHRYDVTGVIKHFACNSQETARRQTEAVVSQRALREIYFRGFELAVKEGEARAIMTSYNPINGVWAASDHDMLTLILRKEWGFDGIVMSDWWAFGSNDDLNPSTTYVASMVRAQNDLFMVANHPDRNSGNDDSAEAMAAGKVTRGEYQRCAMNICRAVLRTPVFMQHLRGEDETERELEKCRADEGNVILGATEVPLDEMAVIDGKDLRLTSGQSALFQIRLEKRGQYEIRVRHKVSDAIEGVIQVSFAVSQDRWVIGMETRNGEDHGWHESVYTTAEITRRPLFYLRIFSATGGMDFDRITVTRIKTLE